MKPFCKICEESFKTGAEYLAHMREHKIAEPMAESDSDFIPEAPEPEVDPLTGEEKKPRKIFRQQPHSPLTEYGG